MHDVRTLTTMIPIDRHNLNRICLQVSLLIEAILLLAFLIIVVHVENGHLVHSNRATLYSLASVLNLLLLLLVHHHSRLAEELATVWAVWSLHLVNLRVHPSQQAVLMEEVIALGYAHHKLLFLALRRHLTELSDANAAAVFVSQD